MWKPRFQFSKLDRGWCINWKTFKDNRQIDRLMDRWVLCYSIHISTKSSRYIFCICHFLFNTQNKIIMKYTGYGPPKYKVLQLNCCYTTPKHNAWMPPQFLNFLLFFFQTVKPQRFFCKVIEIFKYVNVPWKFKCDNITCLFNYSNMHVKYDRTFRQSWCIIIITCKPGWWCIAKVDL